MGASENQPVASNAASQTAPETPSEPAPQSLEAAMERLDSLIKQMESGSLSLEELIARYEQGVKLVKFCEERLAGAEQRIRLISRDQNGKILLEKFGGESNE